MPEERGKRGYMPEDCCYKSDQCEEECVIRQQSMFILQTDFSEAHVLLTPTDPQINLEDKSQAGGQNGWIQNKMLSNLSN